MTPDPRLLIPLGDLKGLDPVGVLVYLQTFPSKDYTPAGICFRSSGVCHWLVDADGDVWDLLSVAATVSLSDAVTRDRVLRWIASRVGLEVGCGAPHFGAEGFAEGQYEWLVVGLDYTQQRCCTGRSRSRVNAKRDDIVVPSLADLDPSDDTRLPDGSRLVDALALAAVARHIGGTP